MADARYRLDKLPPYKSKIETRTYCKAKELSNSEAAKIFRDIYSHYVNDPENVFLGGAFQCPLAKDELSIAMDEAEASYHSMMEIRNQLLNAYQEFLQMRS